MVDFPLFYDDWVDLVYVGEPLLDSDLLPTGAELQVLFADQGKKLIVRQEEDGDAVGAGKAPSGRQWGAACAYRVE